MSYVPFLFIFLFFVWIPLEAAQSPSPSRAVHMKQRMELRRRARLSRRAPVSSASSFSSAVPRSSAVISSSALFLVPLVSSYSASSRSASSGTLSGPSAVASVTLSLDLLPATDVHADIPLLGTVTPILGSVRIFPEQEPVDIRAILIDFVTAPTSVDSLLVYDGDRHFLGRATLDTSVDGGRRFTLKLLGNTFVVPKREERSVYVRAFLKKRDAGGSSGETFHVKEFRVEGDGVWSNDAYGKTLTETFPTFQAARARLTSVMNAEDATGILVAGPRQRIGSFRFTGERGDGSAELRVTSLTFQVSKSSDITLTNVVLRGRDAGDDHGCTVGSTTMSCSGIPAGHGIVGDAGRVLELYADVAVSGAVASPFLQVTLNDPGTVNTAGHISWTDGTTTFTWVQFEQPVVRGIRLR